MARAFPPAGWFPGRSPSTATWSGPSPASWARRPIVFVGGHATNETVIGHLLGPGDLIVHDALAHNSILKGRSSPGPAAAPSPTTSPGGRRDPRTVPAGIPPRADRIEGVYSMDGDIANLPKFIELKKRHKTLLMIDEAHSAGTLGAPDAASASISASTAASVDVWMGTLSKSFGSCGGYVAGSQGPGGVSQVHRPRLRLQRRHDAALGRRGPGFDPVVGGRAAAGRASSRSGPGCSSRWPRPATSTRA